MAATTELIAHNRTEEEISELIGADWLIYQDLEDLIESARQGTPQSNNLNVLYLMETTLHLT